MFKFPKFSKEKPLEKPMDFDVASPLIPTPPWDGYCVECGGSF